MIPVEAPNERFYQYWLRSQPEKTRDGFRLICNTAQLDGYHGEVIVLNGGSFDPSIRRRVAELTACAELRVTRKEM